MGDYLIFGILIILLMLSTKQIMAALICTLVFVAIVMLVLKGRKAKVENTTCTLYEKNGNTQNLISTYKYNDKENITLENFLKQVTFTVDNYEKTCKVYKDNTLFLTVNAQNKHHKITTYEIPLKLDENCKN